MQAPKALLGERLLEAAPFHVNQLLERVRLACTLAERWLVQLLHGLHLRVCERAFQMYTPTHYLRTCVRVYKYGYYPCVYVFVYVCMCVCMHIIYIHIYTYIVRCACALWPFFHQSCFIMHGCVQFRMYGQRTDVSHHPALKDLGRKVAVMHVASVTSCLSVCCTRFVTRTTGQQISAFS
jgi:hypothetical protein